MGCIRALKYQHGSQSPPLANTHIQLYWGGAADVGWGPTKGGLSSNPGRGNLLFALFWVFLAQNWDGERRASAARRLGQN